MKVPPVRKSYGGKLVLSLPELDLEKGKIYAVIGPNGSGKSTFAKILAGVEQSDDKAAMPECSVGYMPQKSWAFRMSTKANIMLCAEDLNRCKALMSSLRIEHLAQQNAKKLSGGETARMALARVLMRSYDLLILDEPTAAMDMESTLLAEALICRCCRENHCAVLLVTHSLQQARRSADKILFLDRGALVEHGDADAVLNHPQQERTERFLEFYGV